MYLNWLFISNESLYLKSEKLYCIPTIGVSISLYMYLKNYINQTLFVQIV